MSDVPTDADRLRSLMFALADDAMTMSDEEIEAEVRAEGLEPFEVAAQMRERAQRLVIASRSIVDGARARLGRCDGCGGEYHDTPTQTCWVEPGHGLPYTTTPKGSAEPERCRHCVTVDSGLGGRREQCPHKQPCPNHPK